MHVGATSLSYSLDKEVAPSCTDRSSIFFDSLGVPKNQIGTQIGTQRTVLLQPKRFGKHWCTGTITGTKTAFCIRGISPRTVPAMVFVDF